MHKKSKNFSLESGIGRSRATQGSISGGQPETNEGGVYTLHPVSLQKSCSFGTLECPGLWPRSMITTKRRNRPAELGQPARFATPPAAPVGRGRGTAGFLGWQGPRRGMQRQ